MNHNKLPKLTLSCVSWPKGGRSPFKNMKTSTLLLTLTLPLTLVAQTGADRVSGPMRKYGGSQLVRESTNKANQRMATLDEMRAYGDLARRVPAHLLSEVSCYMPDYLDEWFVNGKKMPGAPFPSQYCWNRFHADVNAGKKVPLHLRYIVNSQKAQEEFFKSNPGARPSPNPEWDKMFGRTNPSTKDESSNKDTREEENK